jgi:uncharacterized protein (TIGR00251 family)
VVPGSSRNQVVGWLEDTLKVRVAAPPEHGRANASLEQTLAHALGLSRRSVRVVSGKTSARKVVEIPDLSEAEIRQRLSDGAAPPVPPSGCLACELARRPRAPRSRRSASARGPGSKRSSVG